MEDLMRLQNVDDIARTYECDRCALRPLRTPRLF